MEYIREYGFWKKDLDTIVADFKKDTSDIENVENLIDDCSIVAQDDYGLDFRVIPKFCLETGGKLLFDNYGLQEVSKRIKALSKYVIYKAYEIIFTSHKDDEMTYPPDFNDLDGQLKSSIDHFLRINKEYKLSGDIKTNL